MRAQARVVDERVKAWSRRPDDRDALHDARTALRRLRVLVRSFQLDLGPLGRHGVRRRLREALTASSSQRDLDVFAAWAVTLPASAARRHLVAAADADAKAHAPGIGVQMRASWHGARSRLRSGRKDEKADRRPRLFGAAAAYAVRAEVRAVGTGLARFDPLRAVEQVHEARIAAKRLRYLIEGLSGQSPDSRRVTEWCRAFQDLAGEWRDAALASERLRTCPPVAGKAGAIRRVLDRRRTALAELRRFVADVGAWQVARRDALAIARRYALGSRTPGS